MALKILACSKEEMDCFLRFESITEPRRMGDNDDDVYCKARDNMGRTCYLVSDINETTITFSRVVDMPVWSMSGHLRIQCEIDGVTVVAMARPEKGRAVIRTWPTREEAAAYSRDELKARCGLRGYTPFAHGGGFGLFLKVKQ